MFINLEEVSRHLCSLTPSLEFFVVIFSRSYWLIRETKSVKLEYILKVTVKLRVTLLDRRWIHHFSLVLLITLLLHSCLHLVELCFQKHYSSLEIVVFLLKNLDNLVFAL